VKIGDIYIHKKTTEIIEITRVTSLSILGIDIPLIYYNNSQYRIKIGTKYFYFTETKGKLGIMTGINIRKEYRKIGKLD
jgi:hypothetical protein